MAASSKPRRNVSVVMCVRNGAQHLRAALASIKHQVLPPREVIVVDDASTDATPEVLASNHGLSLKVLRNDRQLGPFPSRNRALEAVETAYMAVHDADDTSTPDRLDRQVAVLEDRPNCVAVCAHAHIVTAEGEIVGEAQCPAEERLPEYLLRSNHVVHGTLLVRTEAMRRLGGYRAQFRFCADYDLALRLTEIGRVAVVHAPLYRWRVHEASISSLRPTLQETYAALARESARARRKGRRDLFASAAGWQRFRHRVATAERFEASRRGEALRRFYHAKRVARMGGAGKGAAALLRVLVEFPFEPRLWLRMAQLAWQVVVHGDEKAVR